MNTRTLGVAAVAATLMAASHATGSTIDWSHWIVDSTGTDEGVAYVQLHLLRGETAGGPDYPETWATPDEVTFADLGIEITSIGGTVDPPTWTQTYNDGTTAVAAASEPHFRLFEGSSDVKHGNIEFKFNLVGTADPVPIDFAYQWYDADGNLLRHYFFHLNEDLNSTPFLYPSDWDQTTVMTAIPLPAPVFMGLAGLTGVAYLRRRQSGLKA